MGQLTFQATLGGAINLAGPNIATTTTFTLPSADGTNGQALTTNGTGTLAFATISGTPGGSTTQVQYNNAGAFAGSANMTFNGTKLTLANDASINGVTVGIGSGNGLNTAVGALALVGPNTNANQSLTAIGYAALNKSTNSFYTTAVGAYAMLNTTATTYAVAVGSYALYSQTTGTNNCAIGNSAMYYLLTGTDNVGVGNSVLSANQSGYNNVCMGNLALASSTVAHSNTAAGHNAGSPLTTGSGNVFIGYQTGKVCTTGSANIHLGYNTSTSAVGVGNEIVISTNSDVGKGAQTGFIAPGFGGNYQGNNLTLWSVTSDQRLKKNIVDNNIGLEKLTQIQVRNFEYRLPEEITEVPQNQAIKKTGIQLGVIAQELQAILPECVKTESTGVMSVEADNLTWYMINAIKELKAQNDLLQARLTAANL